MEQGAHERDFLSSGAELNNVRPLRGSNRDDGRQANLSLILALAHRNPNISRSELTRITGLNRSTISDLVGELSELGLITEELATTSSTVGRPSLQVNPRNDVVALSFVPSKASANLAAVGLHGRVISQIRRVIPDQPDPYEMSQIARSMVRELIDQLPTNARIAGIGSAIPGPVDVTTGTVLFCRQLDWVDVEFGNYLSLAVNLPAIIDNDSTLVCAAERDFGAGKDFSNSVYLYGGHGGIGGGAVIAGHTLRGSLGLAGELGHMRISDSKTEDSTGLRGTLEALVRRDDLLHALKVSELSDEALNQAILTSKLPRVQKVVNQQIDYLGTAIANFVNIFNPEAVLLAGFLSTLFEADDYRLLSRVREGTIAGSRERVIIRKAALGGDGVSIGAAELAFAPLLQNPGQFELVHKNKIFK